MAKVKDQLKDPESNNDDVSSERDNGVAERLARALEKVEHQFVLGDMKASVTDYIRLLQMQRECEDDQPRNVEVSWIEPPQPEQSGE